MSKFERGYCSIILEVAKFTRWYLFQLRLLAKVSWNVYAGLDETVPVCRRYLQCFSAARETRGQYTVHSTGG